MAQKKIPLIFFQVFHQSDKLIFYSVSTAFLFYLTQISLLLSRLSYLPAQLPLFYSSPWGEAQLASTLQIFILPSIGIFFLATNLSLIWYLHDSQLSLKRVLAVCSLIISVLLTITGAGIVNIFT